MIRPASGHQVAFTESHDGDQRGDPVARRRVAANLGIPPDWAVVRQVHGTTVLRVDGAGSHGQADAMWTERVSLPMAVFTADCFGVVLVGTEAVGVAHAGWRGAAAGVVGKLREAMTSAGHVLSAAAVGPGIGPCCFEVGPEVAGRFDEVATTRWGTTSVDLRARLGADLDGLETWWSGRCTFHLPGSFSHRLNRTARRMATIVWRT